LPRDSLPMATGAAFPGASGVEDRRADACIAKGDWHSRGDMGRLAQCLGEEPGADECTKGALLTGAETPSVTGDSASTCDGEAAADDEGEDEYVRVEEEDGDGDGADDVSEEEDNDSESEEDSDGEPEARQAPRIAGEPAIASPQRSRDVIPDRSTIIRALANVLTRLASLGCRPQRSTCFHAVCPPQISIHDYLDRIAKYFHCSDACLILGLVYIDRIVKLHPEFVVSTLNIHRLLVTSMMLAAKFHDDIFYSNKYYAQVGGVRLKEFNMLEANFLKMIRWCLHVLPEEYDQYLERILSAA